MARVVAVAGIALVVVAWILWPVEIDEQEAVSESRTAPVHGIAELPDATLPGAAPAAECEPVDAAFRWERLLADLEPQLPQIAVNLSKSTDAEHLLAAALLNWDGDREEALLWLGDAASRAPGNPLIASQVLETCMQFGSCVRALPEMEGRLIAADGANVLAWAAIARSRLARNDEAAALGALRQAAASTVIEDYTANYALLFDRALAASSDLTPWERMTSAIGFAAMPISGAYEISRICSQRGEIRPDWRDVCLRFGERLEHDSRTILGKTIGFTLQSTMLQFDGDDRAAQRVAARHAEFRASWQPLAEVTGRAQELQDETVLRQYVEIFQASDEMQALGFLAGEVRERLPASAGVATSGCPDP